jgi:hypothetical protein
LEDSLMDIRDEDLNGEFEWSLSTEKR